MILETTFRDPTFTSIVALIKYLISISGGRFKIACIRQNLFKIKWSSKIDRLMARCHIQAAATFLSHLIEKGDPNAYIDSVKTTIADILPYIMEFDSNENCSFVLVSTNSLPTGLHYKQMEWLFYKNRLPDETKNRYHLDLLILYGLRLSLEKRILGFLGIDYLSSHGKPVGLSKILPNVAKLKSVIFDPNINWDEIRMVNDWLNHFMHRHLRPYPWVIHQVFEVLNPLLLPGRISDGNTVYGSAYASTFVEDESKLQAEIELSLRAEFSDLKIQWADRREILKAKKR